MDDLLEEDLKLVLKNLPKSTLLNSETFQRAVRLKQYFEDMNGCKSPVRKRKYEKFETESQVVGLVLLRNGFINPHFSGVNPYSADLLEIPELFQKNLKIYFNKRIMGVETSSLKLTKVHFTKAEKEESELIENKTKREIIELISNLISGKTEEEKENIEKMCTMSKNKQYLINKYQELSDNQSEEALNLFVDESC